MARHNQININMIQDLVGGDEVKDDNSASQSTQTAWTMGVFSIVLLAIVSVILSTLHYLIH